MTLESAAETHPDAQGQGQPACDTCGSLFTPKRGWARFCSSKCRSAFHRAEDRKEAIRAAALDLYAALVMAREAMRGKDIEHIWLNAPTEPAETPGTRIDALLGKLKPPATARELLEKSRA